MKKYLLALLLLILISCLPAARKALVIGNASYPEQALRTPVNDANDVTEILRSLDFTVTLLPNARLDEMKRTISEFSEGLDSTDEVIFYYAGHGVQVEGENRLLPVYPQIIDEYEATSYTYSLSLLLKMLSRPQMVIVFLDACRNNPFSWTRSLPSGLSVQDVATRSQYIIISTKAGLLAEDGQGRNSPFAEGVKKYLSEPMPVTALANKIADYVETATRRRQIPTTYGNPRDQEYSIAKHQEPIGIQTPIPTEIIPVETASLPILTPVQTTPPPVEKPIPLPPVLEPKPTQLPPVPDPVVQPDYGAASILSNVDGDIYLDDEETPYTQIKQNTMLPIPNLIAGALKITLKSRKQSETKEVQIKKNQVITVQFQFDTPIIPSGFVLVPGGSFQMGSDSADEKPVHMVTLDSFYMAVCETTVREFREFVTATTYISTAEKAKNAEVLIFKKDKGTLKRADDAFWQNPYFEQSDNHPVTCVSWYDAISYCNWRSSKEGLTPCYNIKGNPFPPNWSKDTILWDVNANGYRLPTEAEWEYAARANNPDNRFSGANDISLVSVCNANSDNRTWEVGSLKQNSFGIFDLSGNVMEWCWDWYDRNYYAKSPQSNPKGKDYGSHRVLRGGSWYDQEDTCGVSFRYFMYPESANSSIGFRLVKSK